MEFQNGLGFSVNDLAEQMTECFEDYVIPITFTPTLVASLMRVDAIDFINTVIAVEEERMVGIALVCRRGKRVRIGGMAVAKAKRSQGLGSTLLGRVIEEARERGDECIVLEAIEHNERALEFYRRLGFEVRFRLVSAHTTLESQGEPSRLTEISFTRLALLQAMRGEDAGSWEMSPATVIQYASPIRAFEAEGFGVAVQAVSDNAVLCRTMARSGVEDERKLRALLRGLAGLFPNHSFRVPPYFPEPEFGELLTAAGMELQNLRQVQLQLNLSQPR